MKYDSKYLIKNFFRLFIPIVIIILIYLFVYYRVSYPSGKLLLSLRKKYVILKAFDTFIYWMDKVYILSFIIVVNIIGSIFRLKQKQEFEASHYINFYFMILTIFFMIMFPAKELILPIINTQIQNIKNTSKQAFLYLKLGKEEEISGNFKKAVEYYNRYLYFEPENDKINEKVNDLIKRYKIKKIVYKKSSSKKTKLKITEKEIIGLYNKGLYFFKKGEYLLAAYYFQRYLEFFTNDSKVKQLYDKSITLFNKQKNKLNRKNQEILRLKAKGIEYLDKKKYIEAYKIFSYLYKKYPFDKTIKNYLFEARKLYNTLDFLIGDMIEYKKNPGFSGVLVKVKNKYNGELLLYFEKIVPYFNEIFFYDIYIHDLKKNKNYFYKFGKQINDYIIVKNQDFENKKLIFKIDINSLPALFLYSESKIFSIFKYGIFKSYLEYSGYSTLKIDDLLAKRILYYFTFFVFLTFVFYISLIGGLNTKNDYPSVFAIIIFILTIYILMYLFLNLLINFVYNIYKFFFVFTGLYGGIIISAIILMIFFAYLLKRIFTYIGSS